MWLKMCILLLKETFLLNQNFNSRAISVTKMRKLISKNKNFSWGRKSLWLYVIWGYIYQNFRIIDYYSDKFYGATVTFARVKTKSFMKLPKKDTP